MSMMVLIMVVVFVGAAVGLAGSPGAFFRRNFEVGVFFITECPILCFWRESRMAVSFCRILWRGFACLEIFVDFLDLFLLLASFRVDGAECGFERPAAAVFFQVGERFCDRVRGHARNVGTAANLAQDFVPFR